MYDHTLPHKTKHFCRYYLHLFSTEEISKLRIKDCFKIIDKQRTVIPKKVNILDLKILKEK